MLLSLWVTTPTVCFSHPRTSNYKSVSPLPATTAIRFRTSYREKLTYLRFLGILDSNPKSTNVPSHETLDQILTIINYLKSKGFSDTDIPKLSTSCPKLFSSRLKPADIGPVFSFLTTDVAATTHESCGLILCCPELLFSNVEYCLKPTLAFLTSVGLERLNYPTNLNAHILNTRVSKLEAKLEFLRSIGFTNEESTKACARLPAIFGYSVENNMSPKVEYLLKGMQRSIEELKEFPQYFGFSLRRRIVPRHMHLMQRSVHISLKRMLFCGDEKFYEIWK
ncbi:hypothetical protein SOVF_121050 [Spinacia oleracea]|uniref:Transcription termination factor MTEF1, chloroplastic n=1 Tax=Spinacia oleracea TaxID=3562 RepID=A0A9R0JFE6_SPIOL|nr:transcription termination factor MTEF1, chloroplastic [Spinacia oleracea]KNA12978.1 hypothetical protein SOVF_121050 [Spinacia oleracea]